ncbi:MAG: methyltransferase domain-containing protein [Phycisphaera sp.]|nr:MAG: methyltransferase domain-containing protein [Phycisphaera sp.]
MHDLAALFRTRFVRELWRRLGRDLGDRPIAIFGAGRHTSWLLDTIADVEGGPRIAFILDDAADGNQSISSIKILNPADARPADVAAVFVSSDAGEAILTERAREWISTSERETTPLVIEPYRGLPPGPYPIIEATGHSATQDRSLPGCMDEEAIDRANSLGVSFPVPTSSNRAGYSPETDAEYIETGKKERELIGRVCASHGVELESMRDILDWGCSTGRVLRHFDDLPDCARLWGCDIDENSIDWAQRHFEGRFRFFSTTIDPHLPVSNSSFDFVYGISIFTHISHNIDTWLMELRRIIRPGGAVLVTVHDEHTWNFCRDNPDSYITKHCPRFNFDEPFTDDFKAHGQGPASQSFWHSKGIRRRWSHAFEVCGIEPMRFCGGVQAGVLLRPRM